MHEGSPSFSYAHPWHYAALGAEARRNAKLTPELCLITQGEQTDRFVRVVLEIPIHGVEEPFTWGVWVSLSERNFKHYIETCDDPDEADSYFGWFCNRLPYYSDTLNLKTSVRPRKGGLRPYLQLERNGHVLAEHFYEGITIEHAQAIAEQALHAGA